MIGEPPVNDERQNDSGEAAHSEPPEQDYPDAEPGAQDDELWVPAEKRVGFVGLAGAPNVGKSTFVNKLIGQKISIVSKRPNTTRERVCGIYTDERMQVILMDLPGLLEPNDRLNSVLMDNAAAGLKGCDVVLHLRDARRANKPTDPAVLEQIRQAGRPVWLVWNKADLVQGFEPKLDDKELPYERMFVMSALKGAGIKDLLEALAYRLPMGVELYDPEQISDRDLRFLAAELVREKLFVHLGQELPYGTAAYTEVFDEDREGKVLIRVVIVTDRKQHKPMIIGNGGRMLKKIGQEARIEIENLLGRPVFLVLWVKISPKWRRNERQLLELGIRQEDSR